MSAYSYRDITTDELTFTNPERLGNCYICNLYNDDDLVYVQTPILEISNINLSEDDNYIEVSSDNKQFIDFLLEMDENCVQSTFNNSEEWFKKDIPYEAIDNMYKERIIESDYNETLFQTRFKLPVVNEKVQCNIYNKDREIIDIKDLNGKNIIMILHFKGLKILKDNFSLDCYINQIKVVDINKYNILNNYAIIDDDIEEPIDENMFSVEIQEVLKSEQLEKERLEKIKSEKLEKINKLREELEKLEN
tara:strand:+ start:204 stop:950 length:747 start_codon:yes stop_codon:yes gene_type:complete